MARRHPEHARRVCSPWFRLRRVRKRLKEFINYRDNLRSEKNHGDIIEDAEENSINVRQRNRAVGRPLKQSIVPLVLSIRFILKLRQFAFRRDSHPTGKPMSSIKKPLS
jgi:hypothetical protein